MALCPGYIGVAQIGGTIFRVSDFSVNPSQDFLFYDHVIGLNDTVPAGSLTKGESVGTIQIQKRIGRPSPISINGGFSFPATESGVYPILFEHAKYGTYFNLDFQYHRGGGIENRSFTDCRVNNFSFSATAEDIVNITTDVFAKGIEDPGTVVRPYQTAEKLITWDKVVISASGITTTDGIQGINFSVNNNLKNIYTTKSSFQEPENLLPFDIRVGMQEVTGSLAVYNIPGVPLITSSTGESTIAVTLPGLSFTIHVVLKPQELAASVGPIITIVPFVGVDFALGT